MSGLYMQKNCNRNFWSQWLLIHTCLIHTAHFVRKRFFKESPVKCLLLDQLKSYWSLTHWGLVTPYGDKRSGSTLAQVMAQCLTAPSNYLKQCWLIISKVLCLSFIRGHYHEKIWRHQSLTHWGRDKWPTFSRRHFQMHFLEWKCINFD